MCISEPLEWRSSVSYTLCQSKEPYHIPVFFGATTTLSQRWFSLALLSYACRLGFGQNRHLNSLVIAWFLGQCPLLMLKFTNAGHDAGMVLLGNAAILHLDRHCRGCYNRRQCDYDAFSVVARALSKCQYQDATKVLSRPLRSILSR